MRRFSLFMALLCGVGLSTGCASRWVRTPVIDQKNITVSLEHKVVKKQVVQQQFDHPHDIAPQHLQTLLSQLEYLEEPAIYGEPDQKPVFQQVELARLVPALSGALARADSNQRVRFVSRNRGDGLLFKKDRRTSGVVFVEPDRRLNLAFTDVNYEILINQMEASSLRDEYPDPLRIKSSFTPLVAPDYAGHRRTEKGKPLPLWVVVDLDNIPEAVAPATESTAEKDAIKGQATAREPGKAAPTTIVSEDQTPAEKPNTAWELRKQESTKKLQYLKELFESGLIDEKEYQQQKEKLLDEL